MTGSEARLTRCPLATRSRISPSNCSTWPFSRLHLHHRINQACGSNDLLNQRLSGVLQFIQFPERCAPSGRPTLKVIK